MQQSWAACRKEVGEADIRPDAEEEVPRFARTTLQIRRNWQIFEERACIFLKDVTSRYIWKLSERSEWKTESGIKLIYTRRQKENPVGSI